MLCTSAYCLLTSILCSPQCLVLLVTASVGLCRRVSSHSSSRTASWRRRCSRRLCRCHGPQNVLLRLRTTSFGLEVCCRWCRALEAKSAALECCCRHSWTACFDFVTRDGSTPQDAASPSFGHKLGDVGCTKWRDMQARWLGGQRRRRSYTRQLLKRRSRAGM